MSRNGLIEIEAGYIDWEVTSDTFLDEEGDEYQGEEYVKINNLFIQKDFRGKGYAKALLIQAKELIQKSYPSMRIVIVPEPKEKCVDFSRLASFYESMGLEVIAF